MVIVFIALQVIELLQLVAKNEENNNLTNISIITINMLEFIPTKKSGYNLREYR